MPDAVVCLCAMLKRYMRRTTLGSNVPCAKCVVAMALICPVYTSSVDCGHVPLRLDFPSLGLAQVFGRIVKILLPALHGDISCARDPFPHLRSSGSSREYTYISGYGILLPSTSKTDKKASIKALKSKIEELEKGMAKAAKERVLRPGTADWLAMPMTRQTIDNFKDSNTGLTRCMLSTLELINKAVKENIGIAWQA